MDALEGLLASRSRAEILRLLFDGESKEFYLRDIERRTGLIIRAVQQEILNLLKLDLIKARRDGNRRYFSANQTHPLYLELCQIVLKTSGWLAELKKALSRDGVRLAFIFGSIARGEERAASDIDLMVVGNIGLRTLSGLTGPVSRKSHRVINPHVYSTQEFGRRLKTKDHFVTSVIDSKKIYLIGTDDELQRLGR
jgi:DNA-binding transcriptional ArsR family regulator